jgi:hypothetical protein
MNMMSLFNTLGRKRERNFHSICRTFEKEGVETVEVAENCRKVMLGNAKVYIIFVLMLGLSLSMLFSSVSFPILVGMGIVLLYILTSVYRARELVARYIEEVLGHPEFVPYSQRSIEPEEEEGDMFESYLGQDKKGDNTDTSDEECVDQSTKKSAESSDTTQEKT